MIYSDAFATLEPIPLIKTTNKSVMVNEFSIDNKVLWTIYNDLENEYKGTLFTCDYEENCIFLMSGIKENLNLRY